MPAPHADEAFFFHPPPPARTTSGNSTASSWGPYSGAGEFGANMAIVLAALLCTVLLALSLGTAIRLLLSRRHSPSEETEKQQPPPPQQQQPSVPAMLYSAAETRLAGAASECAICLTEFEEGDAVRVLPACNHGFHVRCIERWLAARGSCPTCRAFCGVEAGHGREGYQVEVVVQGI